ncbi:MAG: VWA domain-containing protein [Candidatus Symbiobacter sp.]|nr:VWA domain-containing protein [Candidatus Symbiobacter sp.]
MAPDRPPLPPAPDVTTHLVGFAGFLREHGLKIGPAEQVAMTEAALILGNNLDPSLARNAAHLSAKYSAAWRAIACHSPREWRQWPDVFNRYWLPHKTRGSVRVSGQTRPARSLPDVVADLHKNLAETAHHPQPPARSQPHIGTALDAAPGHDQTDPGDESGRPRHQGGASRGEASTDALHDRELSQWSPEDLQHLTRLADQIAARLRRHVLRRWHPQPQGSILDLRHTLRASIATGGVPVIPHWRKRRRDLPRLFILVDVSRSMENYAQLFLRIARAFVQALPARVFVFHTRLTEITPLLQRDSASVQEKINAVTAGFGGGTRIASSVDDFARLARPQLNRSSQIWIFSDGFDADAPENLSLSLAGLKHRGGRVTWFHPTVGVPQSDAITQANCAQKIDRFIRLATLKDLTQAAKLLD